MRGMRPTAQDRGYDSKWRQARAEYLKVNRWCVLCAQRNLRTPASVVDHKEPHKGDWKKFWTRSNWQAVCATCHNGAKQSQERTGNVRGCDENGQPLDPKHHWNG